MDLQLFAERTEEPTPKRLAKARQEGRVARSNDLLAGLSLLTVTIVLRSMGPGIAERLSFGMVEAFGGLSPKELTTQSVPTLLQDWSLLFLQVMLPIAGFLMAVGIAAGTLQTRLLFTLTPLIPQFSTLNPITGLTRMFSLRTFIEVIKGIVKLTAIGLIAYNDVMGLIPRFPNLMEQSVSAGVAAVADMSITVLQRIALAILVIGLLDYGYQYWEFRRSLKMTKDEVKKEIREQDGSPELKSKQRQRARELALRRKALKDVPLADVVVTNPTHYAVALKYDPKEGVAPKVLAKGADLLAQRIKVIARQSQVPMVENRTLARGLYNAVEVGRQIPPEFYQAVAEVLAFVYSLRRQQRQDSL
ncbi:MAG: flagellar biosynthesis protein FlhB [Bacillota bacterium]